LNPDWVDWNRWQDARANFGQELRLGLRIRYQNRKITVVSVKIRDCALVSFGKTIFTGEQIAAFLLFHFDN